MKYGYAFTRTIQPPPPASTTDPPRHPDTEYDRFEYMGSDEPTPMNTAMQRGFINTRDGGRDAFGRVRMALAEAGRVDMHTACERSSEMGLYPEPYRGPNLVELARKFPDDDDLLIIARAFCLAYAAFPDLDRERDGIHLKWRFRDETGPERLAAFLASKVAR